MLVLCCFDAEKCSVSINFRRHFDDDHDGGIKGATEYTAKSTKIYTCIYIR